MQFIRTDPVVAVGEKPESREPLLQWDSRIFHHSASLQSELGSFVLGAAMPAVVLLKEQHIFRFAARAHDAFGPAIRYKILAAAGRIREVNNRVL